MPQNTTDIWNYGGKRRQLLVMSEWWKKVKEICLKICGVNKGNGRLMIGERSKERMTDDSSIATS